MKEVKNLIVRAGIHAERTRSSLSDRMHAHTPSGICSPLEVINFAALENNTWTKRKGPADSWYMFSCPQHCPRHSQQLVKNGSW